MGKFIIDVKSDDGLTALNNEFDELKTEAQQRLDFMGKQRENLMNELNKRKNDIWSKVENRLKELNLIPANYDSEKSNYGFHMNEHDQIMQTTREELEGDLPPGMPPELKKILKRLTVVTD